MKQTLFPIVLLTALFAVVSCSKSFDPSEDGLVEATDAKVFTASIENSDTKTDLGTDKKVNWVQDDKISINGALYTATPKTDATQADFSGSGAKKVDDLYKAYYPSVLYKEGTPTLPSSYTYNAAHPFEVYPMYAQSTSTSLKFSNICGALAITVKSSVLSNVKSITVSSSNCAMSGAFSVEETSTGSGTYKASLTSPTTVANTVTLNCGESGVETTSGGTVFYIPIPAQTYQNIKIVVTPATGNSLTMVTIKDQNILVARNTIYPINFKHNYDFPLSGEFSVTSTKKVKFSRGNLQAKYNGTSYTWQFAANQYDYIGNAAGNTSIDNQVENAVVDLFGWSTDQSNYGINTSQSSSLFMGEFYDWGVKMGSDWRTLSKNEWTYLINTRKVNGGSGTGKSYKRAYVNGVYGMILYPDGYTKQSPLTTPSYSSSTWSTMESEGCVFLPSASYRDGSSVSTNDDGQGYYWSSTPGSTIVYSYGFFFYNNGVTPNKQYCNRYYGYSVRLVKDIN